MKVTIIKVKTNCHRNGFFLETLISYAGSEFFAHMCSDKVKAFNLIERDKLKEVESYYIEHQFFQILSIKEEEWYK